MKTSNSGVPKHRFSIPLPNGDVDLVTIEGGTFAQAAADVLKQYPQVAQLVRNSSPNFAGQAPASAAENIEESLPLPVSSQSETDSNQHHTNRVSGESDTRTEPATFPRHRPIASQILNVPPVNQGEEEALPLPVLNFEKKPGKKVAPVTTRNAPAVVNGEEALPLPVMNFKVA